MRLLHETAVFHGWNAAVFRCSQNNYSLFKVLVMLSLSGVKCLLIFEEVVGSKWM